MVSDEVVAGYVRHLLEHAHPPPERVDLHLLPAGPATQLVVPGPLEARLADEIAAPHGLVRFFASSASLTSPT